jgi:hypothetical protein
VGWRDRAIGIVLGVALGAGVVVAFVFVLSDETVDAPSLSDESVPAPDRARDGGRGTDGRREDAPPVATIRVIGSAPPPAGPAELSYQRGERVRLRVVSDLAVEVELTGYGLQRLVPADSPTEIEFEASRTGTFALIVADSHIDVARIDVAEGG